MLRRFRLWNDQQPVRHRLVAHQPTKPLHLPSRKDRLHLDKTEAHVLLPQSAHPDPGQGRPPSHRGSCDRQGLATRGRRYEQLLTADFRHVPVSPEDRQVNSSYNSV